MTDYERLKAIIDEIPELITANITSTAHTFIAWKTKTERFLIGKFGKDSYEYQTFSQTSSTLLVYTFKESECEYIKACQNGLRTTQAIFQTYLDEMDDEDDNPTAVDRITQPKEYSRVFIVHGHDEALKESVARIIEKQGIDAIILSEKANVGRTIIEKVEDYSDVGGAICLFTADDVGTEKTDPSMLPRARQNVVFEAGFFMGRLGRDRVVLIADGDLEMPSDLSGVVYTNRGNWQFDLLKELGAMGYTVDLNKLL